MKAMILAAGFGKRLLPHTKKIPKPLLKVGNKSLIEHNINYLIKNGFNEIIINVSYLGDLIQEHVKEVFPSRNIIFSVDEIIFLNSDSFIIFKILQKQLLKH